MVDIGDIDVLLVHNKIGHEKAMKIHALELNMNLI